MMKAPSDAQIRQLVSRELRDCPPHADDIVSLILPYCRAERCQDQDGSTSIEFHAKQSLTEEQKKRIGIQLMEIEVTVRQNALRMLSHNELLKPIATIAMSVPLPEEKQAPLSILSQNALRQKYLHLMQKRENLTVNRLRLFKWLVNQCTIVCSTVGGLTHLNVIPMGDSWERALENAEMQDVLIHLSATEMAQIQRIFFIKSKDLVAKMVSALRAANTNSEHAAVEASMMLMGRELLKNEMLSPPSASVQFLKDLDAKVRHPSSPLRDHAREYFGTFDQDFPRSSPSDDDPFEDIAQLHRTFPEEMTPMLETLRTKMLNLATVFFQELSSFQWMPDGRGVEGGGTAGCGNNARY